MATFSFLVPVLLALSRPISGLSLPFNDGTPMLHTSTDPRSAIPDLAVRAPDNPPLPTKDCDYSQSFHSMEAADAFVSPPQGHIGAGNQFRPFTLQCRNWYALTTLVNMLDDANANYTKINDGYDDVFNVYQKYVHKTTPGIIKNALMFTQKPTPGGGTLYEDGPGMQYFDCTIDGRTTACPARKPTDRELGKAFTLKLRDVDGFNKELAKQGLSKDWIAYGAFSVDNISYGARGAKAVLKKQFQNFPIRNDHMVVPNPKDILAPAINNFTSLRTDMLNTATKIKNGKWNGDAAAPVQVYSIPVLLMIQEIDYMDQAKEAAERVKQQEKEEEKEKERLAIVLALSFVLMLVPGAGEEGAIALGLTTLARTLPLAAEIGQGAIQLYVVISDPKNVLNDVLSGLFGIAMVAKVARDAQGISALAAIRATMSQGTMNTIGTLFLQNNQLIQHIVANPFKV